MQEAKNTQRASVRLGYDGRVHKIFRGPNAEERFANEVRVLKFLEIKGCPFVPQVLEEHPDRLEVVTTNCGSRVEQLSNGKLEQIFSELESFGVRHDDAFLRNITYRESDGRFCVIDFELSTIIDPNFQDILAANLPKTGIQNISIQWSGLSHVGRFRPNNEDSFLAAMLDEFGISYLGRSGDSTLMQREFIFAVSDGMGGQQSGEFASKIATQKIAMQLPQHFGVTPQFPQSYCDQVLRHLFESIHQDMLNLSKYDRNCQEMGATLTLLWMRRDRVYFGHIGDSRLYRIGRENPTCQITEDHTFVGYLRRTGKINEREARNHPQLSVLSQCLGSGHRYLKPQLGSFEYASGESLVLCTDGVNDGLWDRGIHEMIESPPAEWKHQSPADRLVLSAVEESGRDNATAVVIQLRNS
jgi:PPM family protein phosphatase